MNHAGPANTASLFSLAACGCEGWWLVPGGAAWHAETQTAVITDLHLGYEWARGRGGDIVPEHSANECLARLTRIHTSLGGRLSRLVVAGDVVESAQPCPRTGRDLGRLREQCEAWTAELCFVAGNHDPHRAGWPARYELNGWIIVHGHERVREPEARLVFGHVHPVIRAEGRSFGCVLAGSDRIVLPAFTRNAAGIDVSTAKLPDSIDATRVRCIAEADDHYIDLGALDRIRAAVSADPAPATSARHRTRSRRTRVRRSQRA